MARHLYTHALNCERFGERDDGTTFERFRVILPEDIVEAINELWMADLISRDIRNAFIAKLDINNTKTEEQ